MTKKDRIMTSRFYRFLLPVSLVLAAPPGGAAAADPTAVVSPDGNVQFRLSFAKSRPHFGVRFRGVPVIEASPLVMTLDGVDITDGAKPGAVKKYEVNETYPTRGVHARAVNRCNGAQFSLKQARGNIAFTLNVRVFNDAVAFRFTVPDGKGPRVPDEATTFTLPTGSTVWYHNLRGHYEGKHAKADVAKVPAGDWLAPPLTFKLPGRSGYASITEAALVNYSGMALQADGRGGFVVRLGHKHPISYPYRLRYTQADIERVSRPAAVAGPITTPWRVVMIGRDLNTLVNCDAVTNLSPPPNTVLFPQGQATGWIKPGPAVWNYLDGGARTLDGAKDFCRMAGELGFKHLVIEGYWRRWSDEEIKDLVAYARRRGVGIWVWSSAKPLRDAEVRRRLFRRCHDLGIAGVKLDFFDHEAKEVVDFYQTLLRETAELRLMVNFHGSNKPTGEGRTWPNELTREAVSGMEGLKNKPIKALHDVALPFTRLLAGPADYTPVHFGRPGNRTSWAHEIASAAILTSPLLTYAANPANLLKNPGVEMVKGIPSVWDETIVLPSSEIGEVAVFARRSGNTWFLAVMNGPSGRTIKVPLAFLGKGKYRALLLRDRTDEAAALRVEKATLGRGDSLTIAMREGGGFIARFRKE
jgi:alpha-glucosidase